MQDGPQCGELFVRWRGVNAIHARTLQPLEFFSGGDVGQDHEFFDQPVAIESHPRANGFDAAVSQNDLPLRYLEIERTTRLSGSEQGAIGGKQVRVGVAILVGLFIGEAGGAAHETATEAMAGLAAIGADPQFGKQTAAILAGLEAAPAIRERFGQHRYDAIGEVDAVTAVPGLAVERRARWDVMCHVGDGDEQAEAVTIRFGPDCVVEIAGVLTIDGHEGNRAEVLSAGQRGGLGGICLGDHIVGKFVRDLVIDDADQADRARIAHRAEALHDANRLEAGPAMRERDGDDDFAGLSLRRLRPAAPATPP